MNLLRWLQRLGIVRFGVESGVYHNAKERPFSFQDDNVFDSKKDVIDLNRRASGEPPVSTTTKTDA